MTRYAAVTRIGSWVLQAGRLQRCGSRTSKRFPNGYQPRLGDEAVGYVRTNDRRQFVYQDLPSRRTWTAPWRGDAPVIGTTPRRLVVSQPSPDNRRATIYEPRMRPVLAAPDSRASASGPRRRRAVASEHLGDPAVARPLALRLAELLVAAGGVAVSSRRASLRPD